VYEGRFIARFIYMRSNVSAFRAFLIKNFTVKEYFERRAREEGTPGYYQIEGLRIGSYREVADRGPGCRPPLKDISNSHDARRRPVASGKRRS
jgi:hypothetical protein